MNNHQAIEEARRRTYLLKTSEAKYRSWRGPNPSFPWSGWGDRPRSCALWNGLEQESLDGQLENIKQRKANEKLSVMALCELAWYHGRSADGIRSRLLKTLGRKLYFETFDI